MQSNQKKKKPVSRAERKKKADRRKQETKEGISLRAAKFIEELLTNPGQLKYVSYAKAYDRLKELEEARENDAIRRKLSNAASSILHSDFVKKELNKQIEKSLTITVKQLDSHLTYIIRQSDNLIAKIKAIDLGYKIINQKQDDDKSGSKAEGTTELLRAMVQSTFEGNEASDDKAVTEHE